MSPPPSSAARWAVLAAVVVSVLAWSRSVLEGGFSYDDHEAIQENPVVEGDLPATEAFRRDYWHHLGDAGQYRPIATLSLRLDHALFGDGSVGYHATNVVLQAVVVLLAGFVLLGLGLPARVIGVGLVVFAAHPVLADAVAWISGRTSMLSALGGLVALASVVRARRVVFVELGVLLGLLFGLLAKEDAIVFALPVLLLAGLRSRRIVFGAGVGVLLAVAAALLLRAGALGSALPSAPHAPLAGLGLGERLLFAGRSLLEGARLALLPVHYPPAYRFGEGFHASAPPSAWAWLGWALWGAWIAVGVLLFVRGRLRGQRSLLIAGGSAVVAGLSLLPVLQVVPAGEVFAPRFLYLPLLLATPVVGAALRRLPVPLVGALVVAMVVLAFDRSHVYSSRAAWAEEVLAYTPGDVAAWNTLGLAREDAGNVAGAREAWEQALRRRPSYSRALSNLGRLALEEGNLDAAEEYLERAVEVGRDNPNAYVNWGALLLRRGRKTQAADAFREALRLSPGLEAARRGLAAAER